MSLRSTRTEQLIVLAASLAVAFVTTAMVAAIDRRDDSPPKMVPVLEAPTGPVVAPQLGPRRTSPAAIPAQGGFASVQVNVDEAGQNIPNDAANEPSIAVDPTAPNRIVIGWRQFNNSGSFQQAGWGYSNDGGRSWTFPGVLEPGVYGTDPVLDFDAEGNFYYNSLRSACSCWVFKSTDGGVNWSDPVPAFGGDKSWMTIDRTGGIGHGNIYQAWGTAGCAGLDVFNRSTDGGASFEVPIPFPTPPRWGTLAVGPNGELYVGGIHSNPFDPWTFLIVRSMNAQNRLETPVFDLTTIVDMGGVLQFGVGGGPNGIGLLGQVIVASNQSDGPMNGEVYMLASVNPLGNDPLDVHFVRSTDGGATWSTPIRVNDDPTNNGAWQWFGTMSVAPNGRIDVIFNDTRNSGVANMSELFYSFSTDGGVTWSANTQLSPVFNSWTGWPRKLGDYYDMISDDVGAHLAWAATFNGEHDVYYLRIGDYDCNSNGIPDNEDLDSGESDDCNLNGIPDECEIAAGTVKDDDGDGIPDECGGCPWDLDANDSVGVSDLLSLLASWGPCKGCPADFDGNGNVGVADLLALLANWGPCP